MASVALTALVGAQMPRLAPRRHCGIPRRQGWMAQGHECPVLPLCSVVDLNFEFGLARQHCSDMQLLFASPETHAEDSALRVNFVSCSDELEPVIFVALLVLGGQLIS